MHIFPARRHGRVEGRGLEGEESVGVFERVAGGRQAGKRLDCERVDEGTSCADEGTAAAPLSALRRFEKTRSVQDRITTKPF